MLGWGLADFFAKKTIDKIGDLQTLFWAQTIGILPLVILFLANPHTPQLNRYDPLFLVLFGIGSALSYLPFYRGLEKGQISILSPIFASYSVTVVILAALFLNTSISSSQLLAIVIVFAGILLASTDPREVKHHLKTGGESVKGVPEVLVAMIGYSTWLLFLDKFLNGKDWVFPLLVIRCIAALTLLVYGYATRQRLSIQDRSLWKYLALIGIFDVAAFSAVSYGFSHTSYISVVTVLSATFSLPTIILAYVFLKERITKLQTIAALLIVCGIMIISLG